MDTCNISVMFNSLGKAANFQAFGLYTWDEKGFQEIKALVC